MSKMKTIGVLTSGGDAPGMNAAIRAIVRTAINSGMNVKGIQRGYAGLLENEIIDMDTKSVSEIMRRGGTILFTARCKEFETPEGQAKGAQILRDHGIEGLIALISSLLDGGYIPVIATVGMDDLGQPYNINADTAAAQIAIALKAEKLVSMTDIAGLLRDKNDESTLIPEVDVSEIEGYKDAGIIAGGMIPKINGMADAIYQGVHEAVIIDGRVPHTVLLELFSNRGSGTRFSRRSHRE